MVPDEEATVPGSIVGFTLWRNLPAQSVQAALSVQREVAGAFGGFRTETLSIGESGLQLWGRGNLRDRACRLDDGAVVVLVGSPAGKTSLDESAAELGRCRCAADFVLPWEGRVVFLKVSGDGRHWTMWNDWVGSVPVWHAEVDGGLLASTLEPVVVSGGGLSADDISLSSLVSLLVNGHFLGDSSLYARMALVPPDCAAEWGEKGFRATALRSVEPTDGRAQAPWDDLVDEMHELLRAAIAETLEMAPRWVIPLSAGLDSRLIAAVAAELGTDVRVYNWGTRGSLDVVYSREVAEALGLPWTHIDLPDSYLVRYTPRWAAWFGSSLHFHGMYQMAFLDAIQEQCDGPIASGVLGDILRGHSLYIQANPATLQLYDDWHTHWSISQVLDSARVPVARALEQLSAELETLVHSFGTSVFKGAMLAEIHGRQRVFTSFQATLADYWRGVGTPFLNRAYARFCFSLSRPALEEEHLLADVFRRHLPRMAQIPGTYSPEPLIRTSSFLGRRRLANLLPPTLRIGPLRGFRDVAPRMDSESVRAHGWRALWPIPEARPQLAAWLDPGHVDAAYGSVMSSADDVRPLRQLQSVQALAYALLGLARQPLDKERSLAWSQR